MIRRWIRAVGALVVLLVLVVGVPVVLIRVAGWPLPGKMPDWGHVATMLRQNDIRAEVVLKAVALVVWVAWLQLAWATVWEFVVNVPAQSSGRRVPVPAPLVAAPVSAGVGRLVAAILAIGFLATSATPAAAARAPSLSGLQGRNPAAAVVVDQYQPAAAAATAAAATRSAVRAGAATWVVADTDSLWDIATVALGDGSHVDRIVQLNPTISPRRLHSGQHLVLPAGANVPADRQPAAPTTPTAPTTEDPVDAEKVTTIVIEAGDTLWARATGQLDQHGADTSTAAVAGYVGEIVASNPTIGDPNLIFPGEQIIVPAVPAASAAAIRPRSESAVVDASTAGYVVVAGDTLWDIIDTYYGRVDADMVWGISDYNRLENPNVIFPGQYLELPADPTTPAPVPVADPVPAAPVDVPVATTETPVDVPAPPAEADTPVVTAPLPPPATTAIPAELPAPSPAPPASTAPPAATTPATIPASSTPETVPTTVPTPPVPVAASSSTSGDDAGMFDMSVRTLWWEIPMGLLLAAGLVAMVRRLRGRRLSALALEPEAEQLAASPPVVAGTELAAAVAGRADRLATLQTLLRTFTPNARAHPDQPPVRAIEVADDRVDVVFAAPAPQPPAGWSSVDGGHSWTHRLGDDHDPGVRQLLTPALVTVGLRPGGGEVMLDLETAGSLSLIGDRTATVDVARSMTLETATYPLGVPIDVHLIGIWVDGIESCDRVWPTTTIGQALNAARTVAAATDDLDESLLQARAATDDDEGVLDPAVFIVDPANFTDAERAVLGELVAVCESQSRAAVIVVGGHPGTAETIELSATGTAKWSGITLTAPRVGREAAAQVAVMLDHHAKADTEPFAVATMIDERHPPLPDKHVDDDNSWADAFAEDEVRVDAYVPPPYDVVVQVLGEVKVLGRDIQDQGSVELLALLTCLRERRPNLDTVTELLNGNLTRTMQNRVGALRARLGVGSAGANLLPSATVGRGSPGRYSVSPLVVTDIDLIEDRFRAAQDAVSSHALTILTEGLTLFNGPAFRGVRKGYDWAWPEGVSARIVNVITAYANKLMGLAFERNDLPLVLETIRLAGHVIDDPIAQVPLRRLEREYADATGHPDLLASAAEAQRRLVTSMDHNDRLADV